ncbi:hypothetical protein SLE2022_085490 [Rubroshorea leprosula]
MISQHLFSRCGFMDFPMGFMVRQLDTKLEAIWEKFLKWMNVSPELCEFESNLFCFICGCMWYVVSECGIGFRLKEAGEKVSYPYRTWLRAKNDYWGPETFEELVLSDSKLPSRKHVFKLILHRNQISH